MKKKHNEIHYKMDLNNQKLKIVHPPPSVESHPVTDPLRKTVEETEDEHIPNLNTIIINNMVIGNEKKIN